jgi:hypothetical protein
MKWSNRHSSAVLTARIKHRMAKGKTRRQMPSASFETPLERLLKKGMTCVCVSGVSGHSNQIGIDGF